MLKPVNVATSRPAIKAYLSTLLFLAASLLLLAISTTAFLLFYYSYVPQIGLEQVIHLQYGDGPHPYAVTALDTNALSSQQPYDISLALNLPRTPNNLAAGNFMLDLALLSRPSAGSAAGSALVALLPNTTTTLAHSRRPAILPYQSPLLSVSHTLLSLPWHTLGLQDLDAETLHVTMFERLPFPRGWKNLPSAARLEIQSYESPTPLQIYGAKLTFHARFQGLRYILYNYRFLSFFAFTTSFYLVALTSTSIAWLWISLLLSPTPDPKQQQQQIKQEEGEDEQSQRSNGTAKAPTGKQPKSEASPEDDEDAALSLSNLSDTPQSFPALGRQMPLRFPVPTQGSSSSKHQSPSSSQTIKREPSLEYTLEETAIQPLPQPTGPSAADDEEEDGEEARGRPFDSGIGTSMESGAGTGSAGGLQRRRSGRGSASAGGSGSGARTPK